MPSRWEAFGLVAIEAMKYGKTVIASNRGALPEIIQDDSDGYIFPDEKGLQYILSVITREDADRKGINAENKFRNDFVEKNMIRRTFFIYQKENFRLDEV